MLRVSKKLGFYMIIGSFIKHIKAYKGINYIPVGNSYNFVSYIGENGIGKSSILEAFDSYFNNKHYPINKNALNDGISTPNNEPFFAPIFLINKEKISRKKSEFEKISTFFWNIDKTDLSSGVKGSMKEFFLLRDSINNDNNYSEDSHYFFILGEQIIKTSPKLYFGSFQNEEKFLIHYLDKDKINIDNISNDDKKNTIEGWKDELNKLLEKNEQKKILQELKNLYSFVYIPVEIDIETFTKLETAEMQKILDKDIVDEISGTLSGISLDTADGVNTKLKTFLTEIQTKLDNKYKYQTGQSRNNNITKSDLVNKILEAYFQKRILYKGDKKVSELSAGEKRQTLIDVAYAFLMRSINREKSVILAIDEPENSLHTSLCYEQFEKLRKISNHSQVLITTHWYGFLPILNKGYGHFLINKEDRISFESYDLYDYNAKIRSVEKSSKGILPNNLTLKSTNDLVQAIYYSIQGESPYNWLLVEGVSEKIYFEYFFKAEIDKIKLIILPLGGNKNVSKVYEYLELPMREITSNDINQQEKSFLLTTLNADHSKDIRTSFGDQGTSSKLFTFLLRRLSNEELKRKYKLVDIVILSDTYASRY
jgi:predicted ATP-dependent endonuclease of OLD family